MGGGTTFSNSSKSERESEEIFRRAIKADVEGEQHSLFKSPSQEASEAKQPPKPLRNVFISFHTNDEDAVKELRTQAKEHDGELQFRDYSIKEPFDEKWKTNCREKIGQTSATIVMIGPHTAERSAVDWEIEESYRQGHKVIGVRMYPDVPIPQPLIDHRARIIKWDPSIISKELDP